MVVEIILVRGLALLGLALEVGSYGGDRGPVWKQAVKVRPKNPQGLTNRQGNMNPPLEMRCDLRIGCRNLEQARGIRLRGLDSCKA
ncbi:hypothetical protein C1H46_007667 [Malus baccata]|uniref:Secreted protein n=1 Tax=Malus baccata TaxID=106549 RepID=A0A540N6P0_MALBA|nr:hypothetical protein C1H46_007667 [Malus baccata]